MARLGPSDSHNIWISFWGAGQYWFDKGVVPYSNVRFTFLLAWIGWCCVGVAAGSAAVPRAVADWTAGACLGVAALNSLEGGIGKATAFVLLTLLGAAAWHGWSCSPQWQAKAAQHAKLLFMTAALCLIGVIVFRHSANAEATLDRVVCHVFRTLNREPDGARVWAYGPYGNYDVFSLFGGRFQHQPLRVDENGSATSQPERDQFLFGQPPPDPTASSREFIANLHAAGITHIVTSSQCEGFRDRRVPKQHILLESSGRAEQLDVQEADDYRFTLWRLKP